MSSTGNYTNDFFASLLRASDPRTLDHKPVIVCGGLLGKYHLARTQPIKYLILPKIKANAERMRKRIKFNKINKYSLEEKIRKEYFT